MLSSDHKLFGCSADQLRMGSCRAEFKGTVTFDLVKYYVSELKQMYKDTDVVVSDANALKALEACPVTELGLVDAMLWLEDNCRKQES